MKSIVVAMTGVSGAMGSEVALAVLSSTANIKIKALFLNTRIDRKIARNLQRKFKSRIEVLFGDVVNYEDCKKLVEDTAYVVHMAALIPPKADHNASRTMATNYDGTNNIVKAVLAQSDQPKLVHISTVAVYGNRNYKHPWVKIGDPLLPSAFDVYAASKLKGERLVFESAIKQWVVLRQTALFHKNFLLNNIGDGLMFHTAWNTPLEWVTARDCGTLIKHIIEYDVADKVPGFWCQCYNIGGGRDCRLTGYDTFDNGFRLIGGSADDFFEPRWNQCRNFHGAWFLDSDRLEELFQFRQETAESFWKWMEATHPTYKLAKIFPRSIIKKFFIKRLLKNDNAPTEWIRRKDVARIKAAFGCSDNIIMYPKTWDMYHLLCKGRIPDGHLDYDAIRNVDNAITGNLVLSHGYDESKPMEDLDIQDMIDAAKFRGGKCLSLTMVRGDLYTPLKWQCHNGHIFYMRPYTVLFGGHWCPECTEPAPWAYDILAKDMPFYAQVWYDTHAKEENVVYYYDNNGDAKYYRLEGDRRCIT